MTHLAMLRLLLDALGLLAVGFYYGTDYFPRGRQWWEGLPDAPPPDDAAVADMERAVVAGRSHARHRADPTYAEIAAVKRLDDR